MKFVLWKSTKDLQWYFKLVAANHETIASSEGYTSKQAAKKGIRAVRTAAFFASVEEIDEL